VRMNRVRDALIIYKEHYERNALHLKTRYVSEHLTQFH
jgi:hypothetical protein